MEQDDIALEGKETIETEDAKEGRAQSATEKAETLMALWLLFAKHKLRGVVTPSPFLDAADLQQAERVGRAYCAQTKDLSFIRVQPAVVADASILPDEPMPAVPPKRVGE